MPVVMHLAEAERTDHPSVDREDLVDWYLEQREADLQTIEQLEEERELIGKALNKLVKVRAPHTCWLGLSPLLASDTPLGLTGPIPARDSGRHGRHGRVVGN